MKRMRISIVVQGRLHAFALARALIAKGAPVQVLTNYPVFMAQRFGLPREHVQGCPSLGLLHRYAYRWDLVRRLPFLERLLHVGFSKWAAGRIPHHEPVAVHVFSGVALEIFKSIRLLDKPILRLLVRGSAHISDQYHDLRHEEKRTGVPMEKPTAWMMRREREEYRLAHRIVTLSSFARQTFLKRGHAPEKILQLSLGSNVQQFRPERAVIDARLARIRSGGKLRVLYTGNVSLQKGMVDFFEAAHALQDRMHFRVVGNIVPDTSARAAAARSFVEFIPRVPESRLPEIYHDADVYLFPTLHDGFAAVLAQANAACLPIIATDHSAAPDIVLQDLTGWIVPVRRADLIIKHLCWCEANREPLARMVETLWEQHHTRDWSDVAEDFLELVRQSSASLQHPLTVPESPPLVKP